MGTIIFEDEINLEDVFNQVLHMCKLLGKFHYFIDTCTKLLPVYCTCIQQHFHPSCRKHLQSTFPSMMGDYMSGEELSKHLGRQMSIHNEKYKEPDSEGELDGVTTFYL